jgi:hypothetical protein
MRVKRVGVCKICDFKRVMRWFCGSASYKGVAGWEKETDIGGQAALVKGIRAGELAITTKHRQV